MPLKGLVRILNSLTMLLICLVWPFERPIRFFRAVCGFYSAVECPLRTPFQLIRYMTSTTMSLLVEVRVDLQRRLRFRMLFICWSNVALAYLNRHRRWCRMRDIDVSTTESDEWCKLAYVNRHKRECEILMYLLQILMSDASCWSLWQLLQFIIWAIWAPVHSAVSKL